MNKRTIFLIFIYFMLFLTMIGAILFVVGFINSHEGITLVDCYDKAGNKILGLQCEKEDYIFNSNFYKNISGTGFYLMCFGFVIILFTFSIGISILENEEYKYRIARRYNKYGY